MSHLLILFNESMIRSHQLLEWNIINEQWHYKKFHKNAI